jgi:predicted ester cyclase
LGTHGCPGKSVTYNEIFIFRLANGRVAETWGVVDVLSYMKQLGVIQAEQGPPAES